MSLEPQVALDGFLEAIREHFAAAAHRTSDTDPRVEATYMALADAFEIYEDALYSSYDEVTPFELFDDVEDAREDGDTVYDEEIDDVDEDPEFDDEDEAEKPSED